MLYWRHATELAVNFKFRVWLPDPEYPVDPALFALWTKSQQKYVGAVTDIILALRATLPESPETIAATPRVLMEASHRYEWIFVGTKPANARFVLIDRLVSAPTP